MKLINRIFNIVTLYLFTVLIITMSMSFLTDYLESIKWFNDYVDSKGRLYWGDRHVIYAWFNGLMLLCSTARVWVSLLYCYDNYIDKKSNP